VSDVPTFSDELFAGNTIRHVVTVWDRTIGDTSTSPITGTLKSLTGASATYTLRPAQRETATFTLSSTASPQTITIDTGASTLTVVAAGSLTSALRGLFYYHVDVTDSAGDLATVLHGWWSFI